MRGTGFMGGHWPTIAMVVLQFTYAAMFLISRAALTQGMSPKVFVVYREAIATIFNAPIAYFAERLEKINIRSLRSIAKVIGTVVSVMGAASMALIKGPKLLNVEFPKINSIFQSRSEKWVLGCTLLFGSSFSWSLWMIFQVPMSKSYPDYLSLAVWMCFFGTIQSGTVAIFLEPDPQAWKFNSTVKILCCIYSGIVGSGISYYLLSWSISRRGPLFCAMFSPMCTVIVTISACIFLHEELYVGSLVGAIAVVSGVYVVLWGKANEIDAGREVSPRDDSGQTEGQSCNSFEGCRMDIKEPLVDNKV